MSDQKITLTKEQVLAMAEFMAKTGNSGMTVTKLLMKYHDGTLLEVSDLVIHLGSGNNQIYLDRHGKEILTNFIFTA